MDIRDFQAGTFRKGYQYSYFLPAMMNHDWTVFNQDIQKQLEIVSLKLGELNAFSKFVPNLDLFIQSYVMKEAVTSSRIEGTKTNMEQAFSDEIDVQPEYRDDWKETVQYRKALNFAIEELQSIPLSNRLLKKVHKILLSQVRGKDKLPGEFRRSQNWIGGSSLQNAIFIPPASEHVSGLMSDMEKFLHNEKLALPHLIKIALAHYQFETIHPFLDGNGRTGRLMIPLYLVSVGVLQQPLLYTSSFFEKYKDQYYNKLSAVREKNDLLEWIFFFLKAVETTAIEAVLSLQAILELKEIIIREKVVQLGKKSLNAQKFLHILFQNPVVSGKKAMRLLELSAKSSNALIDDFVRLGILVEVTGNKRHRLYVFRRYLDILEQ